MPPPARHPLSIATRFLTRLPAPDPGAVSGEDLGQALPWYPVVGLMIGLILVLAARLLGGAPEPVAAALLLVLWVWLTGALHLDGLADTADAWIGGLGDRERTLSIMKDPASGPAGVTALVLVLVTKLACLHALVTAGQTSELIWAPALARAALPLLFATTGYVRPGGIGAEQARHASAMHCRLAAGATAAATLVFFGATGLVLVAAVALVYVAIRAALIRRLGGFTGDTAGAIVEISELTALLALTLTID